MRRPLTSIVMLVFSAVTAFAQTPYVDEKSPNQVRKTAALESLHDILRKHSNLHDEYLEIAAIGNEEDEQFGLELIELIGHDRGYLNFNARRLLADAAPEQRAKWAARAAESGQRYAQLGAIQVLSVFEIDGQDALLRRLADDSDLEIRRQALTRLNDRLRTSLSAAPGNARILREADKDNWIRGVCFNGFPVFGFAKTQSCLFAGEAHRN